MKRKIQSVLWNMQVYFDDLYDSTGMEFFYEIRCLIRAIRSHEFLWYIWRMAKSFINNEARKNERMLRVWEEEHKK